MSPKPNGETAKDGGNSENGSDKSDLGNAARSTAENLTEFLRDRSKGAASDLESKFFGMLAGGVAEISDGLSNHDLGSVIDEAERFARRSPGVFMATAVFAGFSLARFLGANGQSRGAPRSYVRSGETSPSGASSDAA